jgi:hypothetical protein
VLTAIRELGNLGDRKAIPSLLRQLNAQDPALQSEVVRSLGKLKADEAVPALLALLTDNEIYGPRSSVYHAITETFQMLGNISIEIKNAFSGNYPAMFNMGGAALSLPETLGLMEPLQSSGLINSFTKFQNGSEDLPGTDDQGAGTVHKALDELACKVGVMFADARDARQDRVKRLVELLGSDLTLARAAAALTLPWYGDEKSLAPLSRLVCDPDKTVRRAAVWAEDALQKAISYRNCFGM